MSNATMARKPKLSLTAIFIKDPENNGYTGFFAEFPEAVAEGTTQDEVQSNLFEALSIMLKFNKEELEEERALAQTEQNVIERTFELEVA